MCNFLCKFLTKIEKTLRREIKEQTPHLTLLCCVRTVRSSHRRCFIKNLFLKIMQYTQEIPVLESLFSKVLNKGLKASNFIKKRPQHRCFSVNIAKFLRQPILKNIYSCRILTFFFLEWAWQPTQRWKCRGEF